MASTERVPLLQLAEESRDRWRRGELFTADEYIARHPALAYDIRDLFPAIELMEQLKPLPGEAVVPANMPWRDWLLVQMLHRDARRALTR
jgi:hypothetical protein